VKDEDVASMSQTEPNHLLVIAFDSPLKSREAFLAFQRLQNEQGILLHDAVFLDKDEAGRSNVTETIDVKPAEGAARSGLWGALLGTLIAGPVGTVVGGAVSAGLGALSAKLIDIGIPDGTIKELEGALSPGVSALALLVSHVKDEALERELARFAGARLIQSSLTPDTVQRLRTALGAGSPA